MAEGEPHAPFDTADWDTDPDWEWSSAPDDAGEDLRDLWEDAVDRSRAIVTEELGELARQEMDEAGVEQTESSEAFGFYEEGEDAEIPADTDGDLDPDDGLDLEDDYDDDADADEDSDEAADLADADYDFDDFDLDEDGKVDFSEEVDDDDFDFSDIDFDPTQG